MSKLALIITLALLITLTDASRPYLGFNYGYEDTMDKKASKAVLEGGSCEGNKKHDCATRKTLDISHDPFDPPAFEPGHPGPLLSPPSTLLQ